MVYIPGAGYSSGSSFTPEAEYQQMLADQAASNALMAQMRNDWMANPYSQAFKNRVDYSAYDPATSDYLQGLDAYVKRFGLVDQPVMNYVGQDAVDYYNLPTAQRSQFNLLPQYETRDVYASVPTGYGAYGLDLPPNAGYYNPTDYTQRIAPAVTSKTPYEQLLEYQFNVATGGSGGNSDDNPYQSVSVGYNTPIQLVDNRTGKVVYSGTGFDAAMKVSDMAQELARTGGGSANWGVYTAAPGTTDWKLAASDVPNKSDLGIIGDFLVSQIPTVATAGLGYLGTAGQALSGLGKAGASALGAGLGTVASGTIQGKSLGDIAKNAALAAGGTYLGAKAFGGDSTSSGLKEATKGALENAAPYMSPSLATSPLSAVGGIPGTLGSDITVIGGKLGSSLGAGLGSLAPGIISNLPNLAVQQLPTASEQPPEEAAQDIVVKGKPPSSLSGGAGLGSLAPGIISNLPNLAGQQIPDASALEAEAKKKGLSLSDYLQLAGLGLGLVGGAAGGKTGNATIPGGLGGGLSPVFGNQLPAANIPGLGTGGTGLAPRTAEDLAGRGLTSPTDYYRYGYGPEQSFFANVPQGARNTSTAFTGYEKPFKGIENMAEGGYAVGGPGDGREDKIPAMLSDGEYVMDAETVSMLGNGSSKAGAEALDKFRVNIRKHKGKALAKGSFSVNAKKPEQYLKKGRA